MVGIKKIDGWDLKVDPPLSNDVTGVGGVRAIYVPTQGSTPPIWWILKPTTPESQCNHGLQDEGYASLGELGLTAHDNNSCQRSPW